MAGWSDTKTINNRAKKIQLKEEVSLADFPEKEWVQLRLLGPITSFAWGFIEARNTKDPKEKNVKFPKFCLDYNANTGEMDKDIDPYRKGGVDMSQRFLSNVIIRDLVSVPKNPRTPLKSESKQRTMLGEKWFIKDNKSKSYTPVRVAAWPGGVKDKIVSYTDLHNRKFKNKKVDGKKLGRVELSDPKYGIDLLIMFDNSKAGAAKWDVQMAEATPLTKRESNYLIYDLENLESIKPDSLKDAKREWENLKDRIVFRDKDNKIIVQHHSAKDTDDDDDDEDFEDNAKKKKKKKNLKSTKTDTKTSNKTDTKTSNKTKPGSPPWDTDKAGLKKKKKKKVIEDTQKAKTKSSSSAAKKKKAKKFDRDFADLDD